MLNYKVEGEGYPVVFLHGFLESNSMWNYLALDELKCQRIFVELPGHGSSDVCHVLPPAIQSMVDEVFKVLDALRLESYSLVGHSMGGYVALEMKKHRSQAEKVVLLNSNPWSDPPQKVKDRQRVASIVYKAKDLFLREAIPNLFLDPNKYTNEVNSLIQEASSISPDAIAYASLAMSTRHDHSDPVISDTGSYFVIQGAGDKIVSSEKMTSLLGSRSNYFLIKDAGHMAHIEQPTEVIRILKEILSK
jgi:pimeloyl-ACP methyl ester carboxylesterase